MPHNHLNVISRQNFICRDKILLFKFIKNIYPNMQGRREFLKKVGSVVAGVTIIPEYQTEEATPPPYPTIPKETLTRFGWGKNRHLDRNLVVNIQLFRISMEMAST